MDIENIFSYHAPNDDQQKRLGMVRQVAKYLARTIEECVPAGADQTAAIRKVREAVMTANAGIVLDGKL